MQITSFFGAAFSLLQNASKENQSLDAGMFQPETPQIGKITPI
jgi:hypothetical protein